MTQCEGYEDGCQSPYGIHWSDLNKTWCAVCFEKWQRDEIKKRQKVIERITTECKLSLNNELAIKILSIIIEDTPNEQGT